ncbi:MAG: mechanosensitive ion channel family protein [Candidatus Thermoplasmatota archaeon]
MNEVFDIAEWFNTLFEKAGYNVPPILGELLLALIIFIISILVGWIVYTIFEKFLIRWVKKTRTRLDDQIIKNIRAPIYFFVIVVGGYYAVSSISALDKYSKIISGFFSVIEIALVTFILIRIVTIFVSWYGEKRKKRGEEVSDHLLFIFKKLIQLAIIIIAILSVLAAFDVDITGAIVGLGVGGVAIAFALQNVLSDLFSAFTIYFDKPFEIGDFIIIGDDMGTVQKIGIKSTRLQTLQGEELVVSNNELTSTRIQNFKKMQKRRISFDFGVVYSTPLEKLKKIPDIVKKIITDTEMAEVDRVHFKEFADFSLNFEVVYYVKNSDYAKFMDVQQKINLGLKEAFEKEDIQMAFPTTTVHLKKQT